MTMEAKYSPPMSVHIYLTAKFSTPQYSDILKHYCKNLTSHIIWVEQSMNYGITDIISPKGNFINSHDWASTRKLNIC